MSPSSWLIEVLPLPLYWESLLAWSWQDNGQNELRPISSNCSSWIQPICDGLKGDGIAIAEGDVGVDVLLVYDNS